MDGKKIKIDGHFKTNVPSVWAIGDVVAGDALALDDSVSHRE